MLIIWNWKNLIEINNEILKTFTKGLFHSLVRSDIRAHFEIEKPKHLLLSIRLDTVRIQPANSKRGTTHRRLALHAASGKPSLVVRHRLPLAHHRVIQMALRQRGVRESGPRLSTHVQRERGSNTSHETSRRCRFSGMRQWAAADDESWHIFVVFFVRLG